MNNNIVQKDICCTHCGSIFYTFHRTYYNKDGQTASCYICNTCGKGFRISTIVPIPKIPKEPKLPCPECGLTDQVHRKGDGGHKDKKPKYYCYRCQRSYLTTSKKRLDRRQYPPCPKCGKQEYVVSTKKNGLPFFYCKRCAAKFKEISALNRTPIILREACPKCGSYNTLKSGVSKSGQQRYYCKNDNTHFTGKNVVCLVCGSNDTKKVAENPALNVYYCKSCRREMYDLKLDKIPLITELSNLKEEILSNTKITQIKGLFPWYHEYICKFNHLRRLDEYVLSKFKPMKDKKSIDLIVDVWLTSYKQPIGEIYSIIVSREGELIEKFEGMSEEKILRAFFSLIREQKEFRLYVWGKDFLNIIQARAAVHNIVVPNLTDKSGKFKGIVDIQEELLNPESDFRFKMKRIRDYLERTPLPDIKDVPPSSEYFYNMYWRVKQIKEFNKISLDKNQVSALFDKNRLAEWDYLSTSFIRVMDALYYLTKEIEKFDPKKEEKKE